jgi:RNA polymerase sigma-70 factor (ECF subfamily)
VTTDEELAAAAKDGSEPAFDELVARYQTRLLRFLLVRCNNRADAEDAIQDTFVNAWKYIHSYDARWRFSTWLYRIALRNASRQRLAPAVESIDIPDDIDPLSTCIARSERENLWLTARATLGRDAYSALWLRYVEDLPLKDVASALDRSLAWTKVTLMRSTRRLKKVMSSGEPSNYRSELHDIS